VSSDGQGRPVALVTGAATGLGYETCKQLAQRGYAVMLSALTAEEASAAAVRLRGEVPGAEVDSCALDVRSVDSAQAAADRVRQRFGRLDTLVNNAAILEEFTAPGALGIDPAVVLRTIDVNALGVLRVSQAMIPLLRDSGGGNLVNLSSGLGSIATMSGRFTGYRLSKVAINALTLMLHAELKGSGIRVNSVCPGHVKTPFGGPMATREVPEGAAGIVWAATLGPDGPSGGFFRDGAPIPW
jgi:NAD(P)-dependent dehydrogenase (short-subunit alcohol dehydrogenase family)